MNTVTLTLVALALYWLLNQKKGPDTSRVVTQVSPPKDTTGSGGMSFAEVRTVFQDIYGTADFELPLGQFYVDTAAAGVSIITQDVIDHWVEKGEVISP